jgi:4-hydroxy-tetrahydrodipicolinate synthase
MGSTGEVSMLFLVDKLKIISETVKCKKGDMLLYYGCTRTNTQGTIDMVRYVGFCGPFP